MEQRALTTLEAPTAEMHLFLPRGRHDQESSPREDANSRGGVKSPSPGCCAIAIAPRYSEEVAFMLCFPAFVTMGLGKKRFLRGKLQRRRAKSRASDPARELEVGAFASARGCIERQRHRFLRPSFFL